MDFGLSTFLFVNERLTTHHLSQILNAGIETIEIFSARQHFDYHDKNQARDIAQWFDDHDLTLHSLHAPLYADLDWGRSGSLPISITHLQRGKRIESMEEIKRAIEVAEIVPFRYLILHVGVPNEEYDIAKFDAAMTSIEHLRIFAKERGARILLENIPNELSTPERLLQFLSYSRMEDLKFCFDTGHAHLGGGVDAAFQVMRDRIASTHVHDNKREKDDHLFPFDGSIDWSATARGFRDLEDQFPVLFELNNYGKEVSGLPRLKQVMDKMQAPAKEYPFLPPAVAIRSVSQYAGQEVCIQGWLYNLRESGKLLFPLFRDGTGVIQGVVFKKSVAPEVFECVRKLTQESSVRVTGKVRADERAPGGFELDVSDLEVVQQIPPGQPYPITPKDHGIEFLMDHRHLWLRSSRQRAILAIRHEIIKACRDFFDDCGFTLVDTPIFTPAACEGTTTLFEVGYFEDKAYLTQSGQLYNEANAMAVGKTYCFGPTFRAEKSKTRRHLTEFWMIEPEMAFAHLDDAIGLAEDLVAFVIQRVLEKRRTELSVLERKIAALEKCTPPFPRISYDEAVKILREKGSEIEWGGDFGGGDETILGQHFEKPVLVHRYPSAIKAFYMQPDAERPEVSLCVDMLAPEGYGEIIGGGERISDYELLVKRIEEAKLPRQAFEWYLDLRRYGTVPHAGFGMGIERVVAWVCGLDHVRETIPFPRMLYRLTP